MFSQYVCVSLARTENTGLNIIKAPSRTFIQFECAANQTVQNNFFIKQLLKNITKKNMNVSDLFECVANGVSSKSNQQQQPLSINRLQNSEVYLNEVTELPEGKLNNATSNIY